MTDKKDERITIPALRYYVPIFQAGDKAEKILESDVELSHEDRSMLENAVVLKDMVMEKITSLSMPLITRELNKIISKSHLRSEDNTDLFNLLLYAGLDGMKRGLRKFDVDKINKSSTNYLFQWLTTYAKKELVVAEAPFGIPPSRFAKYKKISAVRKKLTDLKGEYATNQEVLDYFHSGKADIKNFNGRVGSSNKPSQDNLNMTMALVEEQENFEQNLMNVDLIDPQEDYSVDVKLAKNAITSFGETIFGVFLQQHAFTVEASAVLKSEIGSSDFSDAEKAILMDLDNSSYRRVVGKWNNLIKDPEGPFYLFLKENEGLFKQFDMVQAMKDIKRLNANIDSEKYDDLFVNDVVGED